MLEKITLMLIVLTLNVLTETAENKNSCCDPMGEKFKKCMNEKGECVKKEVESELENMNIFVDKLDCTDEDRQIMKDINKECFPNHTCNEDYLKVCPTFCSFYEKPEKYEICQHKE